MAGDKVDLITDEMSDIIIETAEKMAVSDGAENLTVRKILKELEITNRVFYNRFHNIDEVLEIVYKNTILKIREGMVWGFDPSRDFFEQVLDIVEKTLMMSYEAKMKLNHFVFEKDSISNENFSWWMTEIEKIIEYAKEKDFIKDVDSKTISYSIWCFIKGFNADAVSRNIPKEEAAKKFRYGFSILIDGLKK